MFLFLGPVLFATYTTVLQALRSMHGPGTRLLIPSQLRCLSPNLRCVVCRCRLLPLLQLLMFFLRRVASSDRLFDSSDGVLFMVAVGDAATLDEQLSMRRSRVVESRKFGEWARARGGQSANKFFKEISMVPDAFPLTRRPWSNGGTFKESDAKHDDHG